MEGAQTINTLLRLTKQFFISYSRFDHFLKQQYHWAGCPWPCCSTNGINT